ncbi:hypothetical protein MTO96_040979 [Rhipicephalus appendiculatus]
MLRQAGMKLYYFCDHPVAGLNWRPTRLVNEVSNSRVCCVCGIIPKTTMKLPCSHFLCEHCYESACRSDSGQCPVDRKAFNKAHCEAMNFPAKKARHLKVSKTP